jgi:uncharacterized protein (TIRG00374 family)
MLSLDMNEFMKVAKHTDILQLAISYIVIITVFPLMALRWMVILNSVGISYGYLGIYDSLMKGVLLGEVTPGKIGEVIRAQIISTHTGVSGGKSLFSVVIDRIYDMTMLAVLSGASMFGLFLVTTLNASAWILIVVAMFVALGPVLLLNRKFAHFFLSPVFNYLIPNKYQDEAYFHFGEFYMGLKSILTATHLKLLFISLIIWMLKFLSLYLSARAMHINVTVWFIIAIGSLSALVSLIPISISGFGTREAVFITLLSMHGVSTELSVGLSFVYYFFSVSSMLLAGGFALLLKGVSPKQQHQQL